MSASLALGLLGIAFGDDPAGYVCTNDTDIRGASCDIGRFGSCSDGNCDLNMLAQLCDRMHGQRECNGFNSNGYLKRCVKENCGAVTQRSYVVSCIRVDVPEQQRTPTDCVTCSGQKPPFDLPTVRVQEMDDWHNPREEVSEAASLMTPVVLSIWPNSSATLRDPQSGTTATVIAGSLFQGWFVSAVSHSEGLVVVEFAFDRWASMAFLAQGQQRAAIRKPVGKLHSMQQPVYHLTDVDADWYCKQAYDNNDWLGRIAANMSDGEPTFNSVSSVFAPNIDDAIFGNPEELNKWILVGDGRVKSQNFLRGNRATSYTHLQLRDYMSKSCPQSSSHGFWPNMKAGMVGRYLRVVELGFWDPDSTCGATMMAVSPLATDKDATSTALLRITTVQGESQNVTYLRVRANQTTSEPLGVDDLGPSSDDFYAAVLAQASRWDAFVAVGAVTSMPASDRRYQDMPNALMTAYLNNFKGMTPEYGLGKFGNEYNEYLPLDTLSLHEGLLEWGHHDVSRVYLSHFFGTDVYISNSTGKIIYSLFGCDGDADYGRLISLYVKAARYSGDRSWASSLLPVIEKMAAVMLQFQQESMDLYSNSSVLHGLARGSPEHDLCGGKSYFFNVNVWMVRGLLDLHAFLQESSLSHNSTLETLLEPRGRQWRSKLEAAAQFTAVRREDGSAFFLHPCVGSDCGKTPKLKPGGFEGTCVEDETCWEHVAHWPGTKQNQLPNYANFRFFSETLLAGTLDYEYEEAIINFRDTHRGTLTGMTRFRDVLDDMPILGYGWGLLSHDKVGLFHTLLAGHSANYLSRGTYWGTEQRQQRPPLNDRWTNNCGDGGEYCSLCMVSSMPPAMWIRWMLVQEHRDLPFLHLARGAPKRWYRQPEAFGITGAPTRFGVVSYSLIAQGNEVHGSVSIGAHPDSKVTSGLHCTVRLISPSHNEELSHVDVTAGVAKLVRIHRENSTAVFEWGGSASAFNFTASFSSLTGPGLQVV